MVHATNAQRFDCGIARFDESATHMQALMSPSQKPRDFRKSIAKAPLLALTLAFASMLSAGADELVKSTFDKTLEPWTTTNPEAFEIEDSHLKMLDWSEGGPLAVKFAMKPGTPLTVSLDFQTVTDTRDGHEFMMSIRDSNSGEGYSITGCAHPMQFGQPGTESGFAAGNYNEITDAGEPGVALPASATTGFQTLVLTFDPATQVVTLTQDGVSVLSFIGKQNLEAVDSFELLISSHEGGPARYVDNVVISGTPAK